MTSQIRAAIDTDITAIREIYSYHVAHGLGTFETEPPSLQEMRDRHALVVGNGFPFLVACTGERVLGYAYANSFRARAAYRYTVEDSIYILPDAVGQGLGSALLNALIAQCSALGLRQMLALIGDSGNAASIGVHAACGFEHIGTLKSVGLKFDSWVDVVMMQRPLGSGDQNLS